MGIRFSVAHPIDVFGEGTASRVVHLIRSECGPAVPLGTQGVDFCLPDEMGWSWWSSLQAFAREKLGPSGSRHIASVDAWQAVYVDADIDRVVLWLEGRPSFDQGSFTLASHPNVGGSLIDRLLRRLSLRKEPALSPELDAVVRQMVEDYGARPGERNAFQVGNLRRLMGELNALLATIGVCQTKDAVEALRRTYAESDDRCDDDPEIQCLCHAWLSASCALEVGAPLWLVK